MNIHRANSAIERRARVPSMREHVEETDEDDESSQDEMTTLSRGSGPRGEAAQLSPLAPVNILQNEFRSLSAIRNTQVHFEPSHKKALVNIINAGEHRINLIISFPDNYPEGTAPVFRFDGYTTIDKALQGKLVGELEETADPLISTNKVCIEKCISRLRDSIEELNSKNTLDMDVRRQSGHLGTHKNIPYPRTCGATFCNDRLVTFQRPIHPAAQSTPRALTDGHASYATLNSRSRANFLSQISRSPKDSLLSPYYKRHRTKAKKEKSGPVHIYDVSSLLPVSKNMATDYRLDPSADTCRHNAEVAIRSGRRDLQQVWKVLEEFMDRRLDADPDNIKGSVPWAYLPLGRPMIRSMLSHYEAIGDFQTLSMIVSMFKYSSPQWLPPDKSLGSSLTLQRSASSVKISGSSPASSLTSRSPPDKNFSSNPKFNSSQTIHLSDSKFLEEWNMARSAVRKSSRRRTDSHNGIMHDMRVSHVSDGDNEMQQHKFYTTTLDPNKGYLYDFYKTTYADQLYRWNLLNVRATLLKKVETESSAPTVALQCARCSNTYTGSSCNCKSSPNLCCALCRSGVRGSVILCINCGHGGHLQHMRVWFSTDRECATGCGCYCLQHNTVE